VDAAPLFVCGHEVPRRVAYDKHRTGSLAHHSVGHRPQHQPVKPSLAVRPHDDPIRFLRLRKRQNSIRRDILVHHELWLNAIVGVILSKFPQLLPPFSQTAWQNSS
jgi:hypothetical protein